MTESASDARRRPCLFVPGVNDSGPDHWQSRWQNVSQDSVRLQVSNWDYPDLEEWMAALDRAVAECFAPPVIVGHSLGCTLAALWVQRKRSAQKTGQRITGAFLVAPPDPHNPNFPATSPSFRDPVESPLGCPGVIIASTNDPYGSFDFARCFAATLDAGIISVGSLGHINADSNLGEWPEGIRMLKSFAAGLDVHLGVNLNNRAD
jgi:predicted alpha/beta hydrolase family esterase